MGIDHTVLMDGLSPAGAAVLRRNLLAMAPVERMSIVEWAERERIMDERQSAKPGPYRISVTPALRGILEAIHEPGVREVVCQKSAQVGWTDGVINNFLGYMIDVEPTSVVMLFPRDKSFKDFRVEKFVPMLEATPALSRKVDLRRRSADNTQHMLGIPGGFIKMVGSNSPSSVKSTSSRVVIVEEPDDCNANLKGQGDAIKLAFERVKTYINRLMLIGGTPTNKGFSAVEQEMEKTDKRKFYVPCHECGMAEPLSWSHVKWEKYAGTIDADTGEVVGYDPEFGEHQPHTAYYECPHCQARWNDREKNGNVARAESAGFGWQATAPFRGAVGFYLNELYSAFDASRLSLLVEKFLRAKKTAGQGDNKDLMAFVTQTLGEPWELRGDAPEVDELRDRSDEYPELTVPAGGLILTAGVDVQHDCVAVNIKAWSRGLESWCVYYGKIYGVTAVVTEGVWPDLTRFLMQGFRHACGVDFYLSSVSVDSGDGKRTEQVYSYVAKNRHQIRGLKAIKGVGTPSAEIFRDISEKDRKNMSKLSKRYKVVPYIVGTFKAKSDIESRLSLTGNGPGRMHWYQGINEEYFSEITSEVRVGNKWIPKAGIRQEGIDTEVYALHGAYSLRLHYYSESDWQGVEAKIRQVDLLAGLDRPADEQSDATPSKTAKPGEVNVLAAPVKTKTRKRGRRS